MKVKFLMSPSKGGFCPELSYSVHGIPINPVGQDRNLKIIPGLSLPPWCNPAPSLDFVPLTQFFSFIHFSPGPPSLQHVLLRIPQWPSKGNHSLLLLSMATRKVFKIFQWLPIALKIMTKIFHTAIFSRLILTYSLPHTILAFVF